MCSVEVRNSRDGESSKWRQRLVFSLIVFQPFNANVTVRHKSVRANNKVFNGLPVEFC